MRDNFRRKERFIVRDHIIETLTILNYASVFSSNSIRILLIISIIYYIEILVCDI